MQSAKQVIVMRKDLGMRKGKMIAQGAHASLRVLLERGAADGDRYVIEMTEPMQAWMTGRCAVGPAWTDDVDAITGALPLL